MEPIECRFRRLVGVEERTVRGLGLLVEPLSDLIEAVNFGPVLGALGFQGRDVCLRLLVMLLE